MPHQVHARPSWRLHSTRVPARRGDVRRHCSMDTKCSIWRDSDGHTGRVAPGACFQSLPPNRKTVSVSERVTYYDPPRTDDSAGQWALAAIVAVSLVLALMLVLTVPSAALAQPSNPSYGNGGPAWDSSPTAQSSGRGGDAMRLPSWAEPSGEHSGRGPSGSSAFGAAPSTNGVGDPPGFPDPPKPVPISGTGLALLAAAGASLAYRRLRADDGTDGCGARHDGNNPLP